MDTGQPESSKRPRLLATSSWASGAPHRTLSLPPLGPLPSGPQHPTPPGPYQPHYPRAPESHHPGPSPHQASPLHTPRPGHHHQHPDDRRHHDHEQFAPMQDFRQPPPSPAHAPPPHGPPPPPPHHAFHNAYPPREPVIKRDSTDEHIAAPRRPPSTGSGPESQPIPQPPMISAPHPPPQTPSTAPPPPPPPPPPHAAYPEDPRRHMSFDSGPPAPPTPGSYGRPASYPPPGPVPHQHPYEPMYTSDPYYGGVQYASSSKKKTTRASQACDSCRALKAKCDETKPCKNCREKNVECKYREPAPKPTDKAQADMLDGINGIARMLAESLEEHARDKQRMNRRMDQFEKALRQLSPQLDLKVPEQPVSEDDKSIVVQEKLQMDALADGGYPDPALPPRYDMPDEEVEKEPGPPVRAGELSIPANHTTGAGYLLDWPCINDMLQEDLAREGIKYPPEFPIRLEELRGLLRPYGRGEGRDPVLRDRDPRVIHGSAEIPDDIFYLDASSPTPGDSSGYIGGFSPGSADWSASTARTGALNLNGIPDFSEACVRRYVQSFEDNILNMHPVILPNELRAMVQAFLNSIPKSSKTSNPASIATFVQSSPQSSASEMTGTKRKRSPGADVPDPPQLQHRIGKPTRTMNNAVVLTILALGKICEHRDSTPDVVHEDERHGQGAKNGYASSPHASSPEAYTPAVSYASTMMSPKTTERPGLSRRQSFQTPKVSPARRNYDTIPGLEYFAIASDIIGNQLGGNTLCHVWANIFAGLYHGQLARVVESHAYIAHGCTILMNILRPSLKRLSTYTVLSDRPPQDRPPLSHRDNQLLVAFWTCLQLESDIIAEIPRHQSGILAQEENLPYPDIQAWLDRWQPRSDVARATAIIESYTAQLYLRKHLNKIHGSLYADDAPKVDVRVTLRNLQNTQSRVESMKWVSDTYKFNEDDPPAGDILSARLRAKYWGAQAITYRPCVKLILDLSFDLRCTEARTTGRMALAYEELSPAIVRQVEDLGPEVWDYARKGVRALIESTQAFHGLGDRRPIVTNIFGTAHAQWGNLLVLSACYRDPFLRREIDGNKLKVLFKKTIAFLRQVSTLTSALRVDQRLLESIYQKLFVESSSVMMQPNASFSSTASGATPGKPQPSPMESTYGQGGARAPMGPPPDHAGMMTPAQHPVGVPASVPAQRDMIGPVQTQGGPVGAIPAPGLAPVPMGVASMESHRPVMAPPPHQPNMMQ